MTSSGTHRATPSLTTQPWSLWTGQVLRVAKLDLGRSLFSWRSSWVYFLAFAPTFIIFIHALVDAGSRHSMTDDTKVLAAIFQIYYVRLGMFFGCLGIFTRLIRGEMVERSLHYYLLSPVRREVLLLGKFVAGSVRSMLIFETATLVNFLLMYLHFGAPGKAYIAGPGMSQLVAYMVITALACLGYGAVFLLFSMLLKNPAPAAIAFMGWEGVSSVMPSFLQKFSISSYLRHLMPVSVPGEGIFALLTVNTEPVPAWIASAGALVLTTFVLALSCYRMRSLEISYTTE